jgi:hypothetical protein
MASGAFAAAGFDFMRNLRGLVGGSEMGLASLSSVG